MSITDDIERRVRELEDCHLFHLLPEVRSDPTVRTVIVSEEVLEAVTLPMSQNWEGHRCSMFRGTLDAFTRGERISVAEIPYDKPGDTILARVDPVTEEIWDIRSIDPIPGIRCLGGFGGKNLFVALTWNYRETLEDGEDWRVEIERCKSEWERFFDKIPRFQGATLNEYISNFIAV